MTIDQIIEETAKKSSSLMTLADEAQQRCEAVVMGTARQEKKQPAKKAKRKSSVLGKIGLIGAALGAGWALADSDSSLPKWLIMAGLGLMVADYCIQRKGGDAAPEHEGNTQHSFDPYTVIHILQDAASKVSSRWFDCVQANKDSLFAFIGASSASAEKKLEAQQLLVYSDKIHVDLSSTIRLLEQAKDKTDAINAAKKAIDEIRGAVANHSEAETKKYEKIKKLID